MEKKHLDLAPIKEALIDLQIELPKGLKAEDLQLLHDKIKADYPKISPRREIEGKFEVKDGIPVAATTQDLGIKGYVLVSGNGQKIAQFRMDGFTFNRLKPYKDWEEFRGEAFKLWTLYSGAIPDCSVKRVGVRFINVLELPHNGGMEKYLKCLPSSPIGNDKRWFVSSFMNTAEFHDPSLDYRVRITQARQRSVKPGTVTIHLDIDVYKLAVFGKDFAKAWEVIDSFQAIKNDIFFGLITDSTEKLYNERPPSAA